jgi:leucyl aminopeptidase (aminopeptidase T)
VSTVRYAELAAAVMRDLTEVKRGESVLVVADTGTDPGLADAYLGAAIASGAQALLVIERERTLMQMELPPALSGALREADVILGIGAGIFTRSPACIEARERGARILLTDPRGMERYLIDGVVNVDTDAMLHNAGVLADLIRGADLCEVTSSSGTDFSCRIGGRPAIITDGRATEPGELEYYPGAQVSFAGVEETISGVVVVDGSVSTLGVVKSPFRITMREGRAVGFDGDGADVLRYQRHLAEQADPKLVEACHISFGLNPRAQISGNIFEDERFLGCLDIGWGAQDPMFQGKVGTSKHHVDIVAVSPTLKLDGAIVISDNQLRDGFGFVAM